MNSMRTFCCVVSVVLFLLAAVMAFDTNNHFHIIIGGNAAPVIAPNMVRALAALGFCIGGGCALIAACKAKKES